MITAPSSLFAVVVVVVVIIIIIDIVVVIFIIIIVVIILIIFITIHTTKRLRECYLFMSVQADFGQIQFPTKLTGQRCFVVFCKMLLQFALQQFRGKQEMYMYTTTSYNKHAD
jgi:hypothetical protein